MSNPGGGHSAPIPENVVRSTQLQRITVVKEPYNVPSDGSVDVAAVLTAAAAAGAVDLMPATYRLSGNLEIPGFNDFRGVGGTRFALDPGGSISCGDAGGASGGHVGGFEVDGQGQAVSAGLHIAGRNSVVYDGIYAHGCLGPNVLIDGGQNNEYNNLLFGTPGGSEVSLVIDHSTGGLNFYNTELQGGARIQQTHADFSGGYPLWQGPSDIHFHGGRAEYPLSGKPLFYMAAGSIVSFEGFGFAGASPSVIVMEPGAQNYPLKTCVIEAWDGALNITVNDATALTALMSAKVPNCPPETIISTVVGNVVTLSIAPTADPTGQNASFGARALDLTIIGSNGIIGDFESNAFDLRGGATVNIIGRPNIENHVNAYLMRHSDQVYIGAIPPRYLNVTNVSPQQQAGDTASFSQDLRVQTVLDGMTQIVTRTNPHRTRIKRDVDPFAHLVFEPGATFWGDGVTAEPSSVGLKYITDALGEWLQAPGTYRGLSMPTLRIDGLAGLSSSLRCLGQFSFIGHPTTGTHYQGEWGVDLNGTLWVCIIGDGTNAGTWIASSGDAEYAWLPSDQALKGWTVPATVAQGTLAPSAGVLRLQRIKVPTTITVSKIWASITTGGTGATALANCFFALYKSDGTRIATSTDRSSDWATAGTKSATLTVDAGQSLTIQGGPGVYVWAAILVGTQSTTNVQFSNVSSNANNAINANISPPITGQFGSGLSALPSSFAPASVTSGAMFWLALS